MPIDPRTPVLVGVAAVQQREEDPAAAAEPLELMIRALEAAAEDAGSRELLSGADAIRAPRGFWDYGDPGRLVAERVGASGVRTQVAEIGVLQTTLFGQAAADIAAGRADVVLLTGAEAKHRSLRAQITGVPAPATRQEGVEADEVLRPHGDILSQLEIALGLVRPVDQYALLETALRHAQGLSLDAHRKEVAELWAGMSQVAAGNPDAWSREAVPADVIREPSRDPSGRNRMLAFPYTKLHNSQWNVDQAAGLILCSTERADRLGIPAERRVHPWVVADSNHMVMLSERKALHRCQGFQQAGQRAFEHARFGPEELDHVELYSCFPVAVRMQLRELGLPAGRPVTVTGGMAFAGGPLNNFVLQAQVRLARLLRDEPGKLGMLNAVSGIMTKQGVSLWSTAPPEKPFAWHDVSEATREATPQVEVLGDAEGEASVVSCTALYDGSDGLPTRAVVLADLPDGRRVLRVEADPELARRISEEELCGRTLRLAGGQVRL